MTPDLAILSHLAARTQARAAEIGTVGTMLISEVRVRFAMLESMHLVAGRRHPEASHTAPRRVYVVTGKGRRKAGINDARQGWACDWLD